MSEQNENTGASILVPVENSAAVSIEQKANTRPSIVARVKILGLRGEIFEKAIGTRIFKVRNGVPRPLVIPGTRSQGLMPGFLLDLMALPEVQRGKLIELLAAEFLVSDYWIRMGYEKFGLPVAVEDCEPC